MWFFGLFVIMRIISRKKLKEFWGRHPDSEASLRAWFHEAEKAEWRNSSDIKAKYRTASIIDNERVVFNICGNKYRLVVHINFSFLIAYIRFIGTHSQDDRIDAESI